MPLKVNRVNEEALAASSFDLSFLEIVQKCMDETPNGGSILVEHKTNVAHNQASADKAKPESPFNIEEKKEDQFTLRNQS